MTTTEKFKYLYEQCTFYDEGVEVCWHIDTRPINRVYWSALHPSLLEAVLNQDLVSVAYLLSMSVVPRGAFIELALKTQGGNIELTKLLRGHNAPICAMNNIDRAQEVGGSDLVVALANPPPSDRHYPKPMPAYYFVRNDTLCNIDPPVLRTWQPNGHPPVTPPWEAYSLPKNMYDHVCKLWKHMKALRRDEARVLRKYNWARARRLVKMRALALFWMEETQKRLCAPGGEGRAKDLVAFEREFV